MSTGGTINDGRRAEDARGENSAPQNRGSWQEWLPEYAAEFVFPAREKDDKYRRGVVGLVTGSTMFPGAALLGTAAAARTGVGMVRYVGPPALSNMVIMRRPEIVLGSGQVQAWVLGSGVPRSGRSTQRDNIVAALGEKLPTVVDAGAIRDAASLVGKDAPAPFIFTPHAGELSDLLTVLGYPTSRDAVESDPGGYAIVTAQLVNATVLLKGRNTYVANENGTSLVVPRLPSVLATAGTGDVLSGIIGGLLAVASGRIDVRHPEALAMIAATGAYVHARAAALASGGAPIVADDIADRVPAVLAELMAR